MNINLTLFGQMISFAVFVWFTMKFVWTPIIAALEARKSRIAAGLAEAERGHHQKDLAQREAKELLHEAKAQAGEIVNLANKRRAQILDEAKTDAKLEGERLLTAAQAEIQQELNHVKEQLRERVVELSVAAAEKILQREIDPIRHREILESVAKQI